MEHGTGSIQKYDLNNLRPNKCDVFAALCTARHGDVARVGGFSQFYSVVLENWPCHIQ